MFAFECADEVVYVYSVGGPLLSWARINVRLQINRFLNQGTHVRFFQDSSIYLLGFCCVHALGMKRCAVCELHP